MTDVHWVAELGPRARPRLAVTLNAVVCLACRYLVLREVAPPYQMHWMPPKPRMAITFFDHHRGVPQLSRRHDHAIRRIGDRAATSSVVDSSADRSSYG